MSFVARIRNLHAGYGRAEVLFGIDLDVREGAVTTLMYPASTTAFLPF